MKDAPYHPDELDPNSQVVTEPGGGKRWKRPDEIGYGGPLPEEEGKGLGRLIEKIQFNAMMNGNGNGADLSGNPSSGSGLPFFKMFGAGAKAGPGIAIGTQTAGQTAAATSAGGLTGLGAAATGAAAAPAAAAATGAGGSGMWGQIAQGGLSLIGNMMGGVGAGQNAQADAYIKQQQMTQDRNQNALLQNNRAFAGMPGVEGLAAILAKSENNYGGEAMTYTPGQGYSRPNYQNIPAIIAQISQGIGSQGAMDRNNADYQAAKAQSMEDPKLTIAKNEILNPVTFQADNKWYRSKKHDEQHNRERFNEQAKALNMPNTNNPYGPPPPPPRRGGI